MRLLWVVGESQLLLPSPRTVSFDIWTQPRATGILWAPSLGLYEIHKVHRTSHSQKVKS